MIPLARPMLPSADALVPYLKRIDESGMYTNFGPLCREYEKRLGEKFNVPALSVSNATQGLIATLMCMNIPRHSLIAVPSYTFIATAAAIVAAGHIPYFVDVEESTWAVSEDILIAAMKRSKIAAAVIVSPFGSPLNLPAWDNFSTSRNIPIAIDAAAGFDSLDTKCKVGLCPVIVSTHATKVFCTGEGGFVLAGNKQLLDRIRIITNHGLSADREIISFGINGKLSEYHSAIGLAELDGWKDKREKWLRVKSMYAHEFSLPHDDWASPNFGLRLPVSAELVAGKLRDAGIENRLSWYGKCHKSPAYKSFPRMPLPVTDELTEKTIFLPMHVGLNVEDIKFIASEVRKSIG